MWSLFSPLIDEIASAAIGRFFLWRPDHVRRHRSVRPPVLPSFCGDLESFYSTGTSVGEIEWLAPRKPQPDGARMADGHFDSPIRTGYPENDRVFLRHWSATEPELSVIGLGGLVQLGYYWFDGLAAALAATGVDFWMMDEPFNHCRTPRGFVPGELIAGAGPVQLIAAVRQAVIDARRLITILRARGQRVGIVGQSYGGWLSLLLSILEPDLDFVVALIPMCDLPAWYRSGLPLARAARKRFPDYQKARLSEILLPVNPIAWKPSVCSKRIELHAATQDRLVLHQSIRDLVRTWNTRIHIHHRGHYSVFFGNRLRDMVVSSIRAWGMAEAKAASSAFLPSPQTVGT